jgi:hypothetical protein
MQLSVEAIQDLKETLIKKYGSAFDLSDEELNEIGLFLVTSLSEVLKHKVRKDC